MVVVNVFVFGFFVWDRGVKKRKYKYDLVVVVFIIDCLFVFELWWLIVLKYWGSDEDLVWDMGYVVKFEFWEL